MKRLRKTRSGRTDTIEAYGCLCRCSCTHCRCAACACWQAGTAVTNNMRNHDSSHAPNHLTLARGLTAVPSM